MLRRLPIILATLAGGAVLVVMGPIALAVAFLRSSPDAPGPALGAQLFVAALALAAVALAAFAGWGAGRIVLRLLDRP